MLQILKKMVFFWIFLPNLHWAITYKLKEKKGKCWNWCERFFFLHYVDRFGAITRNSISKQKYVVKKNILRLPLHCTFSKDCDPILTFNMKINYRVLCYYCCCNDFSCYLVAENKHFHLHIVEVSNHEQIKVKKKLHKNKSLPII